MKRHIRLMTVIIATAVLLSAAGCNKTEKPNTAATTTTEDATADTTGTVQSSTEEAETGSTSTTEEAEKETTKKTTTTTQKKQTTTTTKKVTKKTTTTTKKVTTTKKATTTTKKKTTTTKKATTTTKVVSQYDKVATASDAKVLADRVIYYINKLRTQQGSATATKLPGLTKVAEYRSKQLVTNFAHDMDDIKAAYTACKYGAKYENSTYDFATGKVTYDGTYSYDAPGREAIAYDVVWGDETIDDLAENIAQHYKGSAGHWSYVGSSKYPYIAVGLTYNNGRWYSCIKVTDINQYG